MMFKKSLINFAMIQTVILAMSVNLGFQFSATSGALATIAFIYMMIFLFSLIPSLLVSVAFAYLAK